MYWFVVPCDSSLERLTRKGMTNDFLSAWRSAFQFVYLAISRKRFNEKSWPGRHLLFGPFDENYFGYSA